MPWDPPTMVSANSVYSFYVQHTNGTVVLLTVDAAYLENPPAVEVAFEAAAAVMDASPDFSLFNTSRVTPSSEVFHL